MLIGVSGLSRAGSLSYLGNVHNPGGAVATSQKCAICQATRVSLWVWLGEHCPSISQSQSQSQSPQVHSPIPRPTHLSLPS